MRTTDRKTQLKNFIRQELFEPDISRALKVTVALVVPLVVAHFLAKPVWGILVGIAAMFMTSARLQGSYLERAFVFLVGTVSLGLAVFAGTLAGGHLLPALLLMGLVAGIASLARGIGEYAQVFGISVVVLFLLSLRAPHTPEVAMERSVLVMIGGTWAAGVSLIMWPFRPNLPFYLALAKPWLLSATLMKKVSLAAAGNTYTAAGIAQTEGEARKAIAQVLPWFRKKRRGTVRIRREALKLVRYSSRFGATALALQSELESLPASEALTELIPRLRRLTYELGEAALRITDAIALHTPKGRADAQAYTGRITTETETLVMEIEARTWTSEEILSLSGMVALIESALTYLHQVLGLLVHMEENERQALPGYTFDWKNWFRQQWHTIRLRLQPDSLLLRHSLRVALMAAVGLTVYYLANLSRGYWIVLTVVIVLQPEFGATWEKTRDRLLGTMLGVVVGTALLLSHLPFGWLISAVAFCSGMFVYLQAKNYKIAVVFVTVMLVAMLEMSEPVRWYIAAYRLLATVVGGALAIIAAYVFWPDWESMQFPYRIAKALRANKNYLQQIGHELQYKAGFHPRVIADQRKAEVENLNAQEAIKRLQLEPEWMRTKLTFARQLADHNNKLTRELTSFAAFLPDLRDEVDFPEVHQLIIRCTQVLEELAAAIEAGRSYETPADIAERLNQTAERLEELRRQSAAAPLVTADWQAGLLPYELIYAHIKRIVAEVMALGEVGSRE